MSWYNDSWRHSLAAKGYSTRNKYFYKKPRLTSERTRGQGGYAQPAPKVKQMTAAEEALAKFYENSLPEDERQEIATLKDQVADLRKKREQLMLDVKGLPEVDITPEQYAQYLQTRGILDTVQGLKLSRAKIKAQLNKFSAAAKDTEPYLDLEEQLEDVDDQLRILEEEGYVNLLDERKEENKQMREELKEVNEELRQKLDDLNVLKGFGERDRNVKGNLLPRSTILVEDRDTLLPDYENALDKQDRARAAKLIQETSQLDTAKQTIKDEYASGAITRAQFNRAMIDLRNREQTMENVLTFDKPTEIYRENLGDAPRRTTKRTPEIIGLPKKRPAKDVVADKEAARREREAKKEEDELIREGKLPPRIPWNTDGDD